MVVLDELIKETENKELNERLKKAFSSLADPVVIDGAENETLLFLINRTIKGNKKFLDKSALMLLMDETWRREIIKVTEWIHTHNLKYPYSKADGCIFYHEESLCCRKHKILGYAKDSKQINKCQFLVTEFFWKGNVTSLVEQFAFYSEDGSELVDRLVELGFPAECIPVFQERCSEALCLRLPDYVHQHCKQVRFFQANGKPIAITPVASTGTQRRIFGLTKDPDIYGATVFHDRPSSLGTFVSACGGRVRCLCYPPKLSKNDWSADYLLKQWRYKQHLLNEQALFSKKTFRLLFEILRKEEMFSTFQAKNAHDIQCNQHLQNLIEELFSEILFLKARFVPECQALINEMGESIEKNVIEGDFDYEQAVTHFTRQIHELLERSKHSQALAYEPVLIDAIAKGVRSFFAKQSLTKAPDGFFYLHFERLLVYGANSLSNPYLIGIPSLTAFAGLVDAFLSRLGANIGGTFAIALRRYARTKGHPLSKQVYKKPVVKNDTVIDSQHCDMEFDLFIRLGKSDSNFDLSSRNLYRCLPRRFSGGVLSSPIVGTYQHCSLHKRCNVYSSDNEFIRALNLLPSYARFIADVDPEIRNENLDELINTLKTSYGVLPINKGFRFLGTPCCREGAITNLHAYAESILGLIKLEPATSVIACSETKERIFWAMQVSQHAVKLISGELYDRAL